MAEPTGNCNSVVAENTEESEAAGDKPDSLSLLDAPEKSLDIQQDESDAVGDKLDALSLKDTCEEPLDLQQWSVGAECRAVWSEDGQVYSATVISVDGDHCRVHFTDYGNEENMQLSVLRSPDKACAADVTQDWKAGSRCRAVYSEDGLVYPAVVLWVKGQRCLIRYDNYNNEEEQDIGDLLTFDELHWPSRGAASKGSNSVSSSSDWKRKRRGEENQGERRGGRRPTWREEQHTCTSSTWVKDTPDPQSRLDKVFEDKRGGNPGGDGADKPTNQSFSLFPPFPPPPQRPEDPLSFIPPPPPLWTCGEREPRAGVDDMSNVLMLWYMCGFYTGRYMIQQQNKSTSRD